MPASAAAEPPARPATPPTVSAPASPSAPPPNVASAPSPVAPPEAAPDANADASDAPAHAPRRARDGFYLRMSSGPGFLSLGGHGPAGNASLASPGSMGNLAIGGSIARGLVLAGMVSGASIQAPFSGGPFRDAKLTVDGSELSASHKAAASFAELGLLVDWYPNPAAGWHAGLSAGLGAIVITNYADDSSLVGVSPAGTLFGGYDWAIARNWSIGLSLSIAGATAETMKHSSGGGDAGYRLTPFAVSAQASLLYF